MCTGALLLHPITTHAHLYPYVCIYVCFSVKHHCLIAGGGRQGNRTHIGAQLLSTCRKVMPRLRSTSSRRQVGLRRQLHMQGLADRQRALAVGGQQRRRLAQLH